MEGSWQELQICILVGDFDLEKVIGKKEGWTVTKHPCFKKRLLLLGYNGKGGGRMTKSSRSWAWWCETLIPADTREPLKVQDQPGLHIEFEDSQG